MANNVIGLFDNASVADQVVEDLVNAGFSRRTINRYEGDNTDLYDELIREGIPSDEATYYVDGLSSGGALVSVKADDAQTDEAVAIMNRYANASETEYTESETQYATTDVDTAVTGAALTTERTAPVAASTPVTSGTDDARLEVVEEQLRIGKRAVQRGGVRVRRVVTETPVEEQVTLRDETVQVDRRPIDRPLSASDTDLFTEKSFEFTETDEEAVIAKEARVVEEVVVSKDVQERVETVRDTVRRADVQIEQIGTSYGQTVAGDTRYSGRQWSDIETEVRTDWERDNSGQGTWDEVKDSVRSSWERTRR